MQICYTECTIRPENRSSGMDKMKKLGGCCKPSLAIRRITPWLGRAFIHEEQMAARP